MIGSRGWSALRRLIAMVVVLGALLGAGMHQAVAQSSATEVVSTTVNHVLEILRDPALKGAEKAAQRRQLISDTIWAHFDFDSMASSTLGSTWREMTPPERNRFLGLFRDLLHRSYIGAIESYTDEKVVFTSEEPVGSKGNKMVVHSEIQRPPAEPIPIDYRLKQKGQDWWVYDIYVEGVSLISNYQNSFRKIVAKDGVSGLLDRLRKKVESNESGDV